LSNIIDARFLMDGGFLDAIWAIKILLRNRYQHKKTVRKWMETFLSKSFYPHGCGFL